MVLSLLSAQAVVARQTSPRHVLSGFVTDSTSGERLAGATVYVPALRTGTATDDAGFYRLALPAGSVVMHVSYLGYETRTFSLDLESDREMDVALAPASVGLDGVEVVGEREEDEAASTQMSAVELSAEDVKKLPVLLGEVDVLKALQLLPGVQSGTEGSTGLYVRGGGPDQNLILLDGAPRLQRRPRLRFPLRLQCRRPRARPPHQRRLPGPLRRTAVVGGGSPDEGGQPEGVPGGRQRRGGVRVAHRRGAGGKGPGLVRRLGAADVHRRPRPPLPEPPPRRRPAARLLLLGRQRQAELDALAAGPARPQPLPRPRRLRLHLRNRRRDARAPSTASGTRAGPTGATPPRRCAGTVCFHSNPLRPRDPAPQPLRLRRPHAPGADRRKRAAGGAVRGGSSTPPASRTSAPGPMSTTGPDLPTTSALAQA